MKVERTLSRTGRQRKYPSQAHRQGNEWEKFCHCEYDRQSPLIRIYSRLTFREHHVTDSLSWKEYLCKESKELERNLLGKTITSVNVNLPRSAYLGFNNMSNRNLSYVDKPTYHSSEHKKSLQSAKSMSLTPGWRTIELMGRFWRAPFQRQHP